MQLAYQQLLYTTNTRREPSSVVLKYQLFSFLSFFTKQQRRYLGSFEVVPAGSRQHYPLALSVRMMGQAVELNLYGEEASQSLADLRVDLPSSDSQLAGTVSVA